VGAETGDRAASVSCHELAIDDGAFILLPLELANKTLRVAEKAAPFRERRWPCLPCLALRPVRDLKPKVLLSHMPSRTRNARFRIQHVYRIILYIHILRRSSAECGLYGAETYASFRFQSRGWPTRHSATPDTVVLFVFYGNNCPNFD
jgi:hypothetical protein